LQARQAAVGLGCQQQVDDLLHLRLSGASLAAAQVSAQQDVLLPAALS
jgi:hypothetical protein